MLFLKSETIETLMLFSRSTGHEGTMLPETGDPVILSQNHAGMLDRFLMTRAESSLILIANARSGDLEDRSGIFQGTYAAYRGGDDITGVAAHYWNGMVFFQAPENVSGLFHAVVTSSGRKCTGIAGPYDQVQQILPEILKKNPHPAMNGRDTLFSLSLDALIIPGVLEQCGVTCRHPADEEVPALADLRIAFMREHAGPAMRASLENEARELVNCQQQAGNLWVLEKAGKIVATSAVSAGIPEMVQLGGVYTLPGYRNRGYGGAVVAGSLIGMRARGVQKAILFTGTDMPAAQTMYRALGFRPIGEYGLVIF
jgi:GNAT superfamily N-acetyltransferase